MTALLTLIAAWVAVQEWLIPWFGPGPTTTQVIKTYEDGTCEIPETWNECETPRWERVAHGAVILSFAQESWTVSEWCEAKSSICNNWNFQDWEDPLPFATCILETPWHCTVNGFIFAHDTTQTFYNEWSLVEWEVVCQSQDRTCSDWVVSWDDEYMYMWCHNFDQWVCEPTDIPEEIIEEAPEHIEEEAPEDIQEETTPTVTTTPRPATVQTTPREPNCPSPRWGNRWEPWQTGTAYLSSSVWFGETCESVSIICAFGSIRIWTAWNPWEIAPESIAQSCSVLPPAWCDSACGSIAHWENVTTFQRAFIPFGSWRTCEQETIVSQCMNWNLLPEWWASCSCQIAPPVWCIAPNGQEIPHEWSLTLYEFPRVQAVPWDWADTCVRQRRQCINGTFYDWNGTISPFTFTHTQCEVIPPAAWWWPWGAWIPTD